MWQRRTFHDCATELLGISKTFREAYLANPPAADQERILIHCSKDGVDILKILAVSIRAHQDYGQTARRSTQVGAMKTEIASGDIPAFIRDYRAPYRNLSGFVPLDLREALNKIVHVNPTQAGFFANRNHHDLILAGRKGRDYWLAVLSVIDLCNVVQALPDVKTKAPE